MPDAKSESAQDTGSGTTETSNNTPKTARKSISPEKEIGGRDGPDPTRYGDWEKAGRCIDF
jgi:hypothetical protein